jgi:hypothetical protein
MGGDKIVIATSRTILSPARRTGHEVAPTYIVRSRCAFGFLTKEKHERLLLVVVAEPVVAGSVQHSSRRGDAVSGLYCDLEGNNTIGSWNRFDIENG